MSPKPRAKMLGQLGNESTDMNYQEEDLVVQWRTTTNAGKSTYAGKDARRQTPTIAAFFPHMT